MSRELFTPETCVAFPNAIRIRKQGLGERDSRRSGRLHQAAKSQHAPRTATQADGK